MGFRVMIETALTVGGCLVVSSTERPEDCIEQARRHRPDIVLTELWLPEGAAGLGAVREASPTSMLAVISPLAARDLAARLWPLASVDLTLSKRDRPAMIAHQILDRWRSVAR